MFAVADIVLSIRRAAVRGGLVAACLGAVGLAGGAQADGFWDNTQLIDVSIESVRTQTVAMAARQTLELSDGTGVDLERWYPAHLRDFHVSFLTQMSDDFGLIWGFRTGDRGPKYTIEPSLQLGAVVQQGIGDNAWISLRLTTELGGHLHERPCTANYGDIGGVQLVNCRMAASVLPPAETLGYLFDEGFLGNSEIALGVTIRF